MDALFGLPRKKSAGTSHREPLFRNLYFAPQKEVDDFVNQYSGSSVNNVSTVLIPPLSWY